MHSDLAAVQTVQQQESISGTVVDNTGEAVIGASVIVVGAQTTTGTVTDFDGNFTLKVKPGTQLKITFVGYKEQIVKAANGMKVTLEEESTMLQGVEVVAYGVQKKVTVTGALSSEGRGTDPYASFVCEQRAGWSALWCDHRADLG